MVSLKSKNFVLQWHLTDDCEMSCAHCYIPEARKKNLLRPALNFNESIKLVDDFCEFLKALNVGGRINFTGGNPLLYNKFLDLGRYVKNKKILIGILGNPGPLLEDKNIEGLKEIGVFRYQISIDGMKKTHDEFRGKGAFETAVKGIERLVQADIPPVVLSTVSKKNMKEMPDVAELCFRKGVVVYDFARLVPIGEAKDLTGDMPTAIEYRDFLDSMFKRYEKLKKEGINVRIGTKDPLWNLYLSERGLLKPTKNDGIIYGGCSVGISHLSLDVDGTVYSCRRLEIPIGNVKNEKILDIFLKSPEINEHRDFGKIEGCDTCDILPICRGCRAVAYAVGGSYYSKDPQCWREKNEYYVYRKISTY